MIKNNSTPSISVIMSVYNDEYYLRESIESIIKQTYTNFEFLIVDDASTDSSWSIINDYALIDNRIKKYRRDQNCGLTKNLNFLLQKSKDEYIARMDSDDIALPERLEYEIEYLISNRLDIVWSNYILIDDDSNFVCEGYQPSLNKTLKQLGWKNRIIHPTVLFKKSVVCGLGGYNELYNTGQDCELWRRMKKNGCRFGLVREPLLKLRFSKTSLTVIRTKGHLEDPNYRLAKLCLRNRQKIRSIKYINAVNNKFKKISLIVRLLVGENIVELIKRYYQEDYDKIHKFKIIFI